VVDVHFARHPLELVHISLAEAAYSAIFQIALLSVTKRQPNTEGHKSDWRDYQHQDAFADGLLALLGRRRSGAAAHGATLAERGGGPQEER
jgi:hypothetical protein